MPLTIDTKHFIAYLVRKMTNKRVRVNLMLEITSAGSLARAASRCAPFQPAIILSILSFCLKSVPVRFGGSTLSPPNLVKVGQGRSNRVLPPDTPDPRLKNQDPAQPPFGDRKL